MRDKKLPDRLTIRKTKRISIPLRYIFVDTETDKLMAGGSLIKHILKIGHAIYWQRPHKDRGEIVEHFDFTNSMDFWMWATGKIHTRETVYLFTHNITFDFLVLDGFRLLPCLDFTLKSLYYKFTTAVLRFHNNNKRLVLADSMNYFPVSVEKLALSVGRKKVEVDFSNVDLSKLWERCRSDTEIIYLAIKALVMSVASENLGSFKPTAAAMAHSIFRKSFMSHDIVTNHTPELVQFEKAAYFGGFIGVTQLTQAGDPNVYKLDVNRMYPSVMLSNFYPTRITDYAKNISIKMLEYFLKDYLVVARVKLHAKKPFYPVRTKEGVAYPVGDFETSLTTPMLRYALANDSVVSVEAAAIYTKAKIFDKYIRFMDGKRGDARDRNDLASELFYKTLSSALYGKFGQMETTSKVVGEAPINAFEVYEAFDPRNDLHWKEIHAGGSIVFVYEQGEARYTSYAIAAHVTDYARLKLFSLYEKAGKNNVYYMDTDSLILNEEGRYNLKNDMHELNIGRLKIEDEGRVYVGLAKKDYILGASRKMKGFDKNGIRLEGNIFKTMQSVGFYGAARRDLRDAAFWYEVNKHYNPSLVNVHIEDNGRVTPLRFPDEAGYLGKRLHTLDIVKGLVNKTFSAKQRAMVEEWITL